MRRYETIYILRPNLGEDQFSEIIERTNAIITGDGGSIINLERWGNKKLAYDIRKESFGQYVYVDFAAPGTAILEMERIFRIDDRVLRYLTVKLAETIDRETIDKEKELAATTAAARAEQAAQEENAGEDTDRNQEKSGDDGSGEE